MICFLHIRLCIMIDLPCVQLSVQLFVISLELLAMSNTLHAKSCAEKQLIIKGIEITLQTLEIG